MIDYKRKKQKIVLIDGCKFCFHKPLKEDIQCWCCLKICMCYLKCYQNFNILKQHFKHNYPKPDKKLLNQQTTINTQKKKKAIKDVLLKSPEHK